MLREAVQEIQCPVDIVGSLISAQRPTQVEVALPVVEVHSIVKQVTLPTWMLAFFELTVSMLELRLPSRVPSALEYQ